MFKWLDNALDYGITEEQFWNMTLGELSRAISSKIRVRKLEAREKATYDHILGQLIGIAAGRAFGSVKQNYPSLDETYPTLFDSEEEKQRKTEQQAEISALRFKQFAESFNNRFKAKTEVAEVE